MNPESNTEFASVTAQCEGSGLSKGGRSSLLSRVFGSRARLPFVKRVRSLPVLLVLALTITSCAEARQSYKFTSSTVETRDSTFRSSTSLLAARTPTNRGSANPGMSGTSQHLSNPMMASFTTTTQSTDTIGTSSGAESAPTFPVPSTYVPVPTTVPLFNPIKCTAQLARTTIAPSQDTRVLKFTVAASPPSTDTVWFEWSNGTALRRDVLVLDEGGIGSRLIEVPAKGTTLVNVYSSPTFIQLSYGCSARM